MAITGEVAVSGSEEWVTRYVTQQLIISNATRHIQHSYIKQCYASYLTESGHLTFCGISEYLTVSFLFTKYDALSMT